MTMLKQILNQAGVREFGVCPMPPEDALLDCRAKSRLPENARSVIVCLFPYYSPGLEGNISRYAMVEDYHKVARQILAPACEALRQAYAAEFSWFADSSPIPEVSAAVQAGLGMRGRNGLLITPDYGTYVFLGEIVTDHLFDYSAPAQGSCLGCGRCEAACPGGALCGGAVDISRCVSDISQRKGELTPSETELIRAGGLLWGCDRCQLVCPHNREVKQTHIQAFQKNIVASVAYGQIRPLCKTRAFGFRGPRVLERNYHILYGDD